MLHGLKNPCYMLRSTRTAKNERYTPAISPSQIVLLFDFFA